MWSEKSNNNTSNHSLWIHYTYAVTLRKNLIICIKNGKIALADNLFWQKKTSVLNFFYYPAIRYKYLVTDI